LDSVIELGVNIDHVATVRQARRTWEPDPAWAAVEAHLGGADAITAHLREDRRHINDDDLRRLVGLVQIKLNLEMAATDEMVAIASDVRPQMSTLVPEGRQEITTEGGLDVAGQRQRLTDVVSRLHDAGMIVSAFIDAEPDHVEAAAACGFDACEVHTGPYAEVFHRAGRTDRQADVRRELERIGRSGELIRQTGMQFNAGHALTYYNVQPIAALPQVRELHIGHSIVSRAVFTGLRAAVGEMKRLMREAAAAVAVADPSSAGGMA
jgi:pyridoxine 5-phosphate synthase